MKIPPFLLLFVLLAANVFAQTPNDLKTLVETDIAFAKTAETKGTKAAFLEFLSDDSLVFRPVEISGKLFWKNAKESPALLVWQPAWADISADGNLGYTTGGWENRPDGKSGKPNAFGQYVTIWQKQPDKTFKVIFDHGVSFADSAMNGANWQSPPDAGKGEKKAKNSVTLDNLIAIYSKKSLSSGYFNFLADDVIVLRENKQPFRGDAKAFGGLEDLDREFPADGALNLDAKISKNYGNMMYSWGVYQLTLRDQSEKRWNFLQIWKFRDGRWQIVFDILTPIKV